MLIEEFTNTVFDLFKDGKLDEAKALIKATLKEAVEEKTSEYDIKGVFKYAMNNIAEKNNDELEKLAKEVFSKVKKCKDWNELATMLLQKKGIDTMKTEKVIKILDSLYN